MVKIAFYTPQIDCRGSCVALFDYANYNEKILGNRSIIVVPSGPNNDDLAMQKFMGRFPVIFYENIDMLDKLLVGGKCDILYCIKYGMKDEVVSKNIKTVVHCVFDLSQPHGDVYTAVSESLAKKYNCPHFVPHMISLSPGNPKNNLRASLNIPTDAVVFGRHGGMDTFDLQFCRNVIKRIVRERNNMYFVFLNTPVFDNHPQIAFLPKIVDLGEKNRFINTCDAYLECGSLGHSFGLSIGEFSINNKSIIAYNGKIWNRSHLDILGDTGLYYKDEEEFYDILNKFEPSFYNRKDNNCYKEYTPYKVMKKFKEIFID